MKGVDPKVFWSRCKPRPDGCWIWMWGRNSAGYGGYLSKGAHRVAWELTNGPIPKGMCVCHKCDVRACVNPEHLFVGTHSDNERDKLAKGRAVIPLTRVFGDRNGSRTHPESRPRGANHSRGRAKLTWSLVAEIRSREESNRELAVEYGVRRQTIWAVRAGKLWPESDRPPQ